VLRKIEETGAEVQTIVSPNMVQVALPRDGVYQAIRKIEALGFQGKAATTFRWGPKIPT